MEQVAILSQDHVQAVAFDRLGKVEIDTEAALADTVALVAGLLGVPGGHVTGHEVAKRGVFALEVIVTLRLGDVIGVPFVPLGLGHPDATVVAEAFAHERQLGLELAVDRDAGRVNLHVARVGETGAALVGAPGGGDVGGHGVGGQEVHVAVAAGGQNHRMGGVFLDLAGDEVAADDALGHAVHDHQVHHLAAGVHLHLAGCDLAHHGGVGAEQQLLSRLAPGVEGARYLGAAEGAVGQGAAVLTGKGYALGHTLVDDVVGDLGETVDVGLTGAEVAALDGVVEQTEDGVTVVLVVLGGVDTALGGDGVGAARAVLDAEGFYVVAQFAQGGGGGGAGQAGADDDDLVLPFVGGVNEFVGKTAFVPFFCQRSFGYFRVKLHSRFF